MERFARMEGEADAGSTRAETAVTSTRFLIFGDLQEGIPVFPQKTGKADEGENNFIHRLEVGGIRESRATE